MNIYKLLVYPVEITSVKMSVSPLHPQPPPPNEINTSSSDFSKPSFFLKHRFRRSMDGHCLVNLAKDIAHSRLTPFFFPLFFFLLGLIKPQLDHPYHLRPLILTTPEVRNKFPLNTIFLHQFPHPGSVIITLTSYPYRIHPYHRLFILQEKTHLRFIIIDPVVFIGEIAFYFWFVKERKRGLSESNCLFA